MAKESELGKAVVPIEADLAGLGKDLNKVQGKLERPLTKLGKRLSSKLAKIGKTAIVGGLAGAAVGIAGMAKLAIDALPLEGISDAFAGITGDADKMIAKLREGSLGMVRDADLMMSYNSAAQLVSKTFADQLPDAMGYLGKVSAATGEDMGFMIDSLVKGVGRLSPMILDNLGIQVALSDATAEASSMFGVEAKELSKAQTQAGMMNVVLAKLAKNTAAMPEIAGTAQVSWAALGTTLGNLKDRVGTALVPALQSLMTPLSKVGEYLTAAFDKPQVQEFIARLGEDLAGLGEKLGIVIDKLVAGDLQGALATIFGGDVAAKIVGVTELIGSFVDKVRNLITFLSNLDPATLKIAGSALALAIALPKVITTVTTLATAIKGLNLMMVANPIGLAVTAIILAGVGIAAVTEKIKAAQQAMAEATETTDQKLTASKQTYDEYLASMVDFLREQRNLPPGMSDAVVAMHAVDDGLIRNRENWEALHILLNHEVGPALEGLEEGLLSVGEKIRLATQETALWTDAQTAAAMVVSDELIASVASASTFYDAMVAKAEESRQRIGMAVLQARASGLAEEIALMQAHGQELVDLETGYRDEIANVEFSNNLARLQAVQEYEAQRAALLEAGRMEEAGELTASHGEELAEMERANALAAQLAERKYLQQRMQMMQAHAKEMAELRNQTIRVQAEKLRQAVIEGTISQVSADQQLAILYKGTDARMQR